MDGDIQLERADGERAALTLFAAISTGASFTPVHEAEAGWIISSHVISRCNVRCRVFEIVCPGAFFSGVARLPCPTARRRLSFLLSFCYRSHVFRSLQAWQQSEMFIYPRGEVLLEIIKLEIHLK